MTGYRRHARGFTLVELVWVILLASMFLTILGRLMFDAFYMLRIAGQHADRMAVMDSLAAQMRADALAVCSYEWDGHTLSLKLAAGERRRDVRYTIDARAVMREQGDGETREWRMFRLLFEARCRPGPRADVFYLDFVEQPPPRAGRLPDRAFTLSVLLPASRTAGSGAVGGGSP